MELALRPACELRELIVRREVSPVEVVEACMAQIDAHNGAINAICTLSDRALDDAREAEQALAGGAETPPLLGLPVGIKDVTPVAGLRTTYGSPLYADHVPEEDALVVERLRRAGAIIIGKTNAPEFATGGNTFNELFGATRNPWNLKLSAGGSTGGGAAGLASGMMALAEGTDLGGSLRIPASFCGVTGLRPSTGLVPTYPSDFLWDTMQVTGPMARTAEDVALMLQAVAGPSRRSPLCQPTAGRDFVAAVRAGIGKGLRVAYCGDVAGIGIDEEIQQICRAAAFEMAQAGAVVEEVELDLSFGWQAFLAIRGLWMVTQQFPRLDKLDAFGPNLGANVRAGLKITTEQIGAAENVRGRMWEICRDLLERFDQLLTPCMAVSPFPVEQNYPETIAGKKMETHIDWVAPTFILSLTGLPVASVPCGLDASALPVGLQVVGGPRSEESVLALAQQVQEANPIGLPPIRSEHRRRSSLPR
ncbi:MAG: amidase [Acidobacteriota bacterium]